ncbi:MAG: DUF4145 domain-containing protein [Tissierellales bacterium]|nr:DUF4145 domain-containing protein [Tissierellales bacterium]
MGNEQEIITNTIFCNGCERVTSHTCHGEYSSYTGDSEFYGYRLYVCDKCKMGVLEVFYTNPDICDHAGGNWNEDDLRGEYLYFPERTHLTRRPQEFPQAPKKLTEVYHEIITAFNAGLPRLCAIGIRALIEGICEDKQISGNNLNLQKKIDRLNALTGQGIAEGLHSIRFLGNAAAHELEVPYKQEVELAIELCEGLMVLLYSLNLEQKSKLLKEIRDAKQTDGRFQFFDWTGGRGWK